MYHERKRQFECDHCGRMIPRSEPVRFYDDRHFCVPNERGNCQLEWEQEQVVHMEWEYD